jgi:hypothetical protein
MICKGVNVKIFLRKTKEIIDRILTEIKSFTASI